MKYAAALIAAAVGANAWKNATVVTEVVSSYVTYCPGPTQITHGTKTYTVTKVRFFPATEDWARLRLWGRFSGHHQAANAGALDPPSRKPISPIYVQ